MIDEPTFEFDAVFDGDYLYFYEPVLTPERNAAQFIPHRCVALFKEPDAFGGAHGILLESVEHGAVSVEANALDAQYSALSAQSKRLRWAGGGKCPY